jgi:hypothetical protein
LDRPLTTRLVAVHFAVSITLSVDGTEPSGLSWTSLRIPP